MKVIDFLKNKNTKPVIDSFGNRVVFFKKNSLIRYLKFLNGGPHHVPLSLVINQTFTRH